MPFPACTFRSTGITASWNTKALQGNMKSYVDKYWCCINKMVWRFGCCWVTKPLNNWVIIVYMRRYPLFFRSAHYFSCFSNTSWSPPPFLIFWAKINLEKFNHLIYKLNLNVGEQTARKEVITLFVSAPFSGQPSGCKRMGRCNSRWWGAAFLLPCNFCWFCSS